MITRIPSSVDSTCRNEQMRAIVHTAEEEIKVLDRPKPDPGADEVLIKIHSPGVNGGDVHAHGYAEGFE